MLTVVPIAQFPLLCARWWLSFVPYNWAATFVLCPLAYQMSFEKHFPSCWLQMAGQTPGGLTGWHAGMLCSQPQLSGASVGLTSAHSTALNFCPTLLNLWHLLTPGWEPPLQLAREIRSFPLCPLYQGDGRIQSEEVGGGNGPEQLGPPHARIAATGLG